MNVLVANTYRHCWTMHAATQKHEQNTDNSSCIRKAQAMVVSRLACVETCSRAEVFTTAHV